MFVSKRRWILKTCGTTTPLECLQPLIDLTLQIAGYEEIEDLFYSRKNYKRPELQVSPHRGFEEEVAYLDQYFDDGRAYCLGSINGECWYLYTVNRGGGASITTNKALLGSTAPTSLPPQSIMQHLDVDPDQTIEILMTDLDLDVMSIFTKDECNTAKEATEVSESLINYGFHCNVRLHCYLFRKRESIKSFREWLLMTFYLIHADTA